jgi:two-component system chemotaxis sensor kinase CheA
MSEIELDPELLSDFIVESRELLDEYSSNLIDLEQNPEDVDTVGAIFRAAHTLKGSSAFFNLVHIKNFAHKLENLLDDIRNRRRPATSEAIDILLEGGGHLKNMFDRLAAGDYSTELGGEEEAFLGRLIAFLEQEEERPPSAEEALARVKQLAEEFKKTGADPETVILQIDQILADLALTGAGETPAGGEGDESEGAERRYLVGQVDLTEILVPAEKIIDAAQTTGQFDGDAYGQALHGLQELVRTHDLAELEGPVADAVEDFDAVQESTIGFDPIIISILKEKLDAVLKHVEVRTEPPPPSTVEAPEEPTPAAEPEPDREPAAKAQKAREDKTERKTMRIDEDKVDGFMSYVGELIVTAESFNYLQKMIESERVNPQTVRAFKNANQAFRELSDELQESLMEIRRVPIKATLQKVTLMARDLSHQMEKKVKVEVEGQEVQIDKSIAESLEGPLVHVVRNSLDHGLETPDDRVAAGKAPEGTLQVKARADREFFYLEVIDDGRGIDPDNMRAAAIKKGVMSEAQAASLTDKEAVNLIFGAGFSTAKSITDVSGRGVGMDVVRNNINQLNGSVVVESEVGRGTTINFKIPLSVTLQVIKALLVRVGQQHFIISLDQILESLRPMKQELTTVEGRGEIINRRGQIIPLIRLYDALGIETDMTDPTEAILVVVETHRGRYALMVDKVIGQQQVVVKELDAHFKNLSFLSGSATLGDGRLGLVLDSEGLVRLSQGLK